MRIDTTTAIHVRESLGLIEAELLREEGRYHAHLEAQGEAEKAAKEAKQNLLVLHASAAGLNRLLREAGAL